MPVVLACKADFPTAVLNEDSAVRMSGFNGPAGPAGPAGPTGPAVPEAAIVRIPRPGVIVTLAPGVSVTSSFRELMLLTTCPAATLAPDTALSASLSVV